MHDKNRLTVISLAIACAVLAIATLSFFQHSNSLTQSMKRKQDEFSAKLSEYKKNVESLQAAVDEKVKAITEAEDKIKEFEFQIGLIKQESEKTRSELNSQRKILLRKNSALSKKLKSFNNASLESLMTETLEKEENGDIKKVLADALAKVELLRAGKSVSLEPIVVTKSGEEGPLEQLSSTASDIKIVELDRKNNLIAINAGRKDNLGEGARLTIIKDGKEAAYAEIIAVRYRVASAYVNSMRPGYAIKDIKEGDEVVIAAE
jgi:predicted nuclease with TOPRIM domain